ncbi:sugar-binding transcriptional regulator [Periweissella beninensis]|uniref:Sugar-binding transcriptional regulator n=1 Tax=Periweissella beninensis TaxID=504936 RepID=A0ABT0VJK2_9LACO|nr:sugar-binding domain-containing protein [Periweissella beninensis]MBM7543620.1 DNA-binding transcriptional regulator LsrR (DeoR family) [Periweissella beninensis]MCM2436600.1 sugar-binding transcriptional regulator [Periweissella beninensis]MCT4395570.1 sugar-binding transcriptional regulator [Periweissella beninensis]
MNIAQREMLANLAQDYYLSNLSLADLTEKYHLSRYLINKYLDDAKLEGIVTINIASPTARNLELEQHFEKKFNIKNCYIIKDTVNPNDNEENIIKYAAKQIELLIAQSHIVGTTWGETIYNITSHFETSILEDVKFTQFMGENMKYNSAAGSMRMVERVASKFSAEYITMVGPLYITDDRTRIGLVREISSQPAFAAASRMDLIFAGFGTLSSVNSIPAWRQNINKIFPNISLDQIAGMLYGRPYDIYGNFLNVNDDKIFGIDLPTVLATPRRFCVLKSKFKTRAALGALRGNMLTDFVTNESLAHRILTEMAIAD